MSAERSFEAWEEVQRHGLDLADRLTQGVSGLIQSHITPPSFSWLNHKPPKLFDVEFPSYDFVKKDFLIANDYHSGFNGVLDVFDIGSRLEQVGADFGASLNVLAQQFLKFLPLPLPFKPNDIALASMHADVGVNMKVQEDLGSLAKRLRDFGFVENDAKSEESLDEKNAGFSVKASENFGKSPEGTVNVTSTYDSRRHGLESSLVAKGDLWRAEASQGSSTSGNGNSSLFLLQLGPVLFVRDTILLPIHLSKKHMLWYGYDGKNGMHSICPAVWSKHRRWLLMSMICLNPLTCSFMDLQFPNGQFTYVCGEGISTSAFLPFCGGLLQAQGRLPGEMMFSYSQKNKWGTCITPTIQWPDRSFSLNLAQALAWKRSGLLVRPTIELSLSPTIGGSNPGLRAELVHSLKEQVSLICGCALVTHPSAFASISLGRSKWNGNVGTSGIVLRAEVPLNNVVQPYFSIQVNSGIEF